MQGLRLEDLGSGFGHEDVEIKVGSSGFRA